MIDQTEVCSPGFLSRVKWPNFVLTQTWAWLLVGRGGAQLNRCVENWSRQYEGSEANNEGSGRIFPNTAFVLPPGGTKFSTTNVQVLNHIYCKYE